jgi:hypothetical protein
MIAFDINPELRRNLWLQCSWQRLVGGLVVGGTIAYALYAFGGFARLFYYANFAILIIFGMWGPRRAADSLAEEVGSGTWEMQRMCGLSAWSMVWGKLVGGSAFVWYCGILALVAYVIAGHRLGYPPGRTGNFWLGIYLTVMGAALSHAAAFAISLLLMRKAVFYRRLTITLAQTIGFLVYVLASGVDSVRVLNEDEIIVLPEKTIGAMSFSLAILGAALGTLLLVWTLIAAFRLMRAELQYRAWPWVWGLFIAFSAFVAGIVPLWPEDEVIGRAGTVFLVLLLLCYVSALADRRDPIRYRAGLLAIQRGEFARGLAELPWWLLSYVAFLIVTAILVVGIVAVPRDLFPDSLLDAMLRFDVLVSYENLAESVLLVPLFLLRDLLILLWLSCGSWRQRADMTWLVYLALIYWPLGIILAFSGYYDFITVVLPFAGDNPIVNFGPVLCQVMVASLLLGVQWRDVMRSGTSLSAVAS